MQEETEGELKKEQGRRSRRRVGIRNDKAKLNCLENQSKVNDHEEEERKNKKHTKMRERRIKSRQKIY